MEHTCGACLSQVDVREEQIIQCTRCVLIYHPLCLNINDLEFDKLEQDYLNSWECPNCTSRVPKNLIGKCRSPAKQPCYLPPVQKKGTTVTDVGFRERHSH
ncbi:unnamed protein product [Leptosia nina]|uniref:PHD-type domain-containing protein n=1 Tax=Leptosia nina TaxID=320188 RepID=A0AAV1IYG2_9NEOP